MAKLRLSVDLKDNDVSRTFLSFICSNWRDLNIKSSKARKAILLKHAIGNVQPLDLINSINSKLFLKKSRCFSAVIYPDKAPENWLSKIKDNIKYGFVSPLHDKDVGNDANIEKPHYHIMAFFDNLTSISEVQDLFKFFGCSNCSIVNSPKYFARFLCHLDNPCKEPYSVKDVVPLGSLDYEDFCFN